MAQIRPNNSRRKAVRYGVPVAVAGVAAATVGLVPALASSGDPDLPKISAEELVTKMAKADVDHLSGTVRISTDLGLPSLPGGSGGGVHGPGAQGEDGSSAAPDASPANKLAELASGEHTLRFAADGPDKQRVSVLEDAAEYSVIHNGRDLWAYDSAADAAWHSTAPDGARGHGKKSGGEGRAPAAPTPQEAAKRALDAVGKSASVSVDGTAKIAGRDAYQLVLRPKDAPDTTVGAIRIAVDADKGVPLRFTLEPKQGGKPVVDVAYTKIDFGRPDAGGFDFTPPKGTKVTEGKPQAGEARAHRSPAGLPDLSGLEVVNKSAGDWNKVAKFDTGMQGGLGDGKTGGEAGQLLDRFTDKAEGDFGTGRVFTTRLVNALITDDGEVYVGAVTKDGLVKAADRDARR